MSGIERADTTYAVNYKLNSSSEQGLFTLQKYSQQVLPTNPVTPTAALANYLVTYQASYTGGNYSGAVDNFMNSQGGFVYTGNCKSDFGGVTCPLSTGDNLSNLHITAQSDFVPTPAPTPGPTPVKTNSGMFVAEYGNWVSGTIYQPFWSNDVNAMVYPEVNDNGQTYAACWAIDPTNKSISPSQSYQKDSQGVWRKFDNNQAANVCDVQAAKAQVMSATAVRFW